MDESFENIVSVFLGKSMLGFKTTAHLRSVDGSGSTRSPRLETRHVPPYKKNGTSDPRLAARGSRSSLVNPRSQSRFRPSSVAAASELPPPSPAAMGIRLVKVIDVPRCACASSRSSQAARTARLSPDASPGTSQSMPIPSESSNVSVSCRLTVCTIDAMSRYPSSRLPSASSVKLIFAYARVTIMGNSISQIPS